MATEKLVLILPPFKKVWLLDDLVELYQKMIKAANCEVDFIKDDQLYAAILFEDRQYKKTLYLHVTKDLNKPGIRITNKLLDVPEPTALKALKVYLGRSDVTGKFILSPYQKGQDLFYDMIRITESIGTSFKLPDSVGLDAKYSGYSDSDPGNNALILSLREQDLINAGFPTHHSIKIKYLLMKEAINSLADQYYIHLHLWHWPHQRFNRGKFWRDKYDKYLDYKGSYRQKFRKKAWRAWGESLHALRLRIIELQAKDF